MSTRANREMLLSAARDLYIDACTERLQPNTLKTYQQSINTFIKVVGDIQIGNVQHTHATKYFKARRGLEVSTRNLNRTHLIGFFVWLRQLGYLPAGRDPFFDYRKPFTGLPTGKLFVEGEQFSDLLDSVEHPRDRAAAALGLYTQLRGGDVRRLRVGDVDRVKRRIAATIQKSNKRDSKPIAPALAAELERWLAWYEDRCGPLADEWFLVPSKTKPKTAYDRDLKTFKMVPNSVGVIPTKMGSSDTRWVHKALRATGMEPARGAGTHTFRRSGANEIVQTVKRERGQAEAIELARVSLNHASARTTELYLQVEAVTELRDELFLSGELFSASPRETDNVIPLRRAASGG